MDKFKRSGYVLFGAGVALLGEHIVNYGASFTYPPDLDHGFYGLIMIIISFVLLARRGSGDGTEARPDQCRCHRQSTTPTRSDAQ